MVEVVLAPEPLAAPVELEPVGAPDEPELVEEPLELLDEPDDVVEVPVAPVEEPVAPVEPLPVLALLLPLTYAETGQYLFVHTPPVLQEEGRLDRPS